MKIIKYSFFILVILFILAFVTNPDKEMHQTLVKEKIESGLTQALSKQGISADNTIIKSLKNDVFDNMVWTTIENNIEYKNYYFFSISQVNYMGESYPISIGFFKYVMVMPQLEKRIEDKLNSYIKENGGLKEFLGF